MLRWRYVENMHLPALVNLTSRYHWGEFQIHVFHLVPSISLIFSVINLQSWQIRSKKADQSTKPSNVIVYV